MLAELIVLDIDYRRRRGETPTKQEYLDRFPEGSKAINDAQNEGDKRTGVFEPPTVGRLDKLFPSLEIIELIGAGGMGAVYKARQSGLDRLVAEYSAGRVWSRCQICTTLHAGSSDAGKTESP